MKSIRSRQVGRDGLGRLVRSIQVDQVELVRPVGSVKSKLVGVRSVR